MVPLLALIAVAAPDSAAPAAPPKPMLICRAPTQEVGSRIRKGRQCKTAEEWAVLDAERDRKPANMRVTEGQVLSTGAPGSPH